MAKGKIEKLSVNEITDEVIKKWKSKHGKVYELSATVDGERKKGYFKKPSRIELAAANMISDMGMNLVKKDEAILSNCFLGGDDELIYDDKFFLSLHNDGHVQQLIKQGETEIKEV